MVRLHPEDAALLRPQLTDSKDELKVVDDPSMSRGNCQIDDDELGVRFDGALQLRELRERILLGLTDADATS